MSPAPELAPIELVVARYRERVEWTRNVPREVAVTIHDKGGDLDPASVPGARVERRENVGREAETYLHHLCSRRDRLAPLTVFCQGHPFDHVHDLHRFLRALVRGEEEVPGFRWLGFIIDSDDPRGRRLHVPWSKNPARRELDVDGFLRSLTGEPAPEWLHFYPGAHFALQRELALERDEDFYRRAHRLSVEFPGAPYCFERTWDRVFGVRGVDPELLGGDLCRYLKPIRRLAGAEPGEPGD